MRSLLLSALLFSSCSAALDLERAHPEQSGTPTAVVTAPVTECLSLDTGKCSCRTACTKELNDCVADPECRAVVARHAACTGAACKDHDARGNSCSERLFTEASAAKLDVASKFVSCISDCQNEQGCESAGGALLSRCERYCGCMQVNCSQQTFSPTCMDECMGLAIDNVSCRTSHCEYSTRDIKGGHCNHAHPVDPGGPLDKCVSQTASNAGKTCLIGNRQGGPCDAKTPCCDDSTCQGGFCTP